MKLIKYIFPLISVIILLLTACDDDEGRFVFPDSTPEMSDLSYSITDKIVANDTLFFTVNIKDTATPLSTLEIVLTFDEKILYTESIRTEGQNIQISKHGIHIPFSANMEEGEARLTITAINVEGNEFRDTKVFTIKRPQIPATIYMHTNEGVIALEQSSYNPHEYISKEGSYPVKFTGKITTDASLNNSRLIWGYSEKANMTEISTASKGEFSFDYSGRTFDRITFNTFSFKLGIIEPKSILKVNGTVLKKTDSYYTASIQFTKGAEVEVSGFDDLGVVFNRDFFDYDPETDKLTFIRETGTWEMYYYPNLNYMWIARMEDEAPDAYWVIGHGFTCAPVWNIDYNSGGWKLDDIAWMGYAVKIADNRYQCTVYLSNTHSDGNFDIQFYSRRDWVEEDEMAVFNNTSFSGDFQNIKFEGDNNADIVSDEGFVPGYFRLTLDTSEGLNKSKLNFERLSN